MGEHVVELACDPAALRDCRRPQLLFARVLELGEQQLGRVLARPRLLDEVRGESEQRAQQCRRDDRRGRAAGERLGENEPDRVAAASPTPSGNGRRATAIHTAAPPASSVAPRGCSATSATPGRAHRTDHARPATRGGAR